MENVAVLFGGVSSEYDVSLKSAFNLISGFKAEKDKYNVLPVGIAKNGEWYLYSGDISKIENGAWIEDTANLKKAFISPSKGDGSLFVLDESARGFGSKKIDVVFPITHGKNGEDGAIQGLCELADIPYVGCGVGSSAICMDKVLTNSLLTSHSIEKPEYIWIYKYDYLQSPGISIEGIDSWAKDKYPVFVKPAKGGSSIGISKVKNKEELKKAVELAFGHDYKILIERAIDAREIECAVIGAGKDIFASVLGEIISVNDFYDYKAKYVDKSVLIEDVDLPYSLTEKIKETAKTVYNILECNGFARVDFLLEKGTDRVLVNEVNTLPGFTAISMFPRLLKKSGYEMSEILEKLIIFAKLKREYHRAVK